MIVLLVIYFFNIVWGEGGVGEGVEWGLGK